MIKFALLVFIASCTLYADPGDQWDIDLPLASVSGPCGGGEVPAGALALRLTVDQPTTDPALGDPDWTCTYADPSVVCERDDLPYRVVLTVRPDYATLVSGACTYVFEAR